MNTARLLQKGLSEDDVIVKHAFMTNRDGDPIAVALRSSVHMVRQNGASLKQRQVTATFQNDTGVDVVYTGKVVLFNRDILTRRYFFVLWDVCDPFKVYKRWTVVGSAVQPWMQPTPAPLPPAPPAPPRQSFATSSRPSRSSSSSSSSSGAASAVQLSWTNALQQRRRARSRDGGGGAAATSSPPSSDAAAAVRPRRRRRAGSSSLPRRSPRLATSASASASSAPAPVTRSRQPNPTRKRRRDQRGKATNIGRSTRDDATTAQLKEVNRQLAAAAADPCAPYSPPTLVSQTPRPQAQNTCYRRAAGAVVGKSVELSARGFVALEVQGGTTVHVLRELLREHNLSLERVRVLSTFDRIVLGAEGRTIIFLAEYIVRGRPVAHWVAYLGAVHVLVDRPGQGAWLARALPLDNVALPLVVSSAHTNAPLLHAHPTPPPPTHPTPLPSPPHPRQCCFSTRPSALTASQEQRLAARSCTRFLWRV